MALFNDSQINSLVFSYLQKTCPKSAKTFSKSTKSEPLTPGSPTLEELLNQRSLKSIVPEGKSSNVQKQQGLKKAAQKEQSSSEDSSSDSESKAESKVKVALKPNNLTAISKFAQISDSSSDSDDETKKPNTMKIGGKNISSLNGKKSVSKAESSDSSSESEAEAKSGKALQMKVNLPSKTTKGMVANKPLVQKKDSSSSDFSSDSDNETKVKLTMVSPKQNTTVSKKQVSSSDDSDSDSASKPISVKPTIQKVGIQSPQATLQDFPSIKTTIGNKGKQSSASSNKKTVSKDESSSDSSSESETEAKPNLSLNKGGNLTAKVAKVVTTKKSLAKKDSSSSDSDDSDDEAIKHAPKVTTPQTQKVGLTAKKQVSDSTVKTPKVTTKKSPAKKDSSSSDSDDSDDEAIKHALKVTTPQTQKVGLTAKKQVSSSNSTVKTPKITKKSPVKKDSSSSDSDDSDDEAMPAPKGTTPQTQKVGLTAKKQASSSDSSSDSESSSKPTNKKSATQKATTPLPKTPLKESSIVKSKKKADSSSDSSSDEETGGLLPQKSVLTKKTVAVKPLGGKGAGNETSSSSDSEEELSKDGILKPNITMQKGKALMSKKTPTKVQKQQSSSSDDSSSEEETPKSLSGVNRSNVTPAANSNTQLSKKSILQKKVGSPAVNINKKTPIKKDASSSSDSSSDSEPKTSFSAPVVKAQPKKGSDSSDSDVPKKVPTIQSKSPVLKQNTFANKKGEKNEESSSSESDSEDDVKSKTVKYKTQKTKKNSLSSLDKDSFAPTNKKIKVDVSLKRKHGASTESSSDSEGESKLHIPNQLPTQPQKKQKLNNSFSNISESNLSIGETTPIASDSTKKRRGSSPFRRIKDENFIVDHRLQKSSAEAKHFIPSLGASKGKQFRHEKTKKKRNNSAGKIDLSVNSIKFE